MPAGTHTWIHNPETDGLWECPNTVLDVFVGRGWELAEQPGEPAPSEPEPFDPAEHTVAEVNAYLAVVADNPAEVQRVRSLELAGLNRKSLVGSSDETS